ncbi:hypothetical protein FRB99_003323 [Tulasnella sp. 403]|nr:hypothetical protein FRB99_003323 [Tulasnella sp. 403]
MSDANTSTSAPPEPMGTKGTAKKSRRSAAFYPHIQNKPSMPFSKSAAKRESVMALGSIEHLQYYFSKAGLARKTKPRVKGLVPALGPSIVPTVEISASSPISPRTSWELPPSPVIPTVERPPYPTVDRVYPQTDPDNLKPGLIRDLEETEKAWALNPDITADSASKGPHLLTAANVKKSSDEFFDVLSVLQTTTKTIRSVRNYLVSLPEDYHTQGAQEENTRDRLGSSLRGPATSRRSSPPSAISMAPPVPFPVHIPPVDPHARIRKAALDVLAMLRVLEESKRIPLSDDAYDSLSVGSGVGDVPISTSDEYLLASRSQSPPHSGSSTNATDRGPGSLFSDEEDNDSATSASMSHQGSGGSLPRPKPAVATFVPLKGSGGMVQVWADDDDTFEVSPVEESKGKGEVWDQRLVVGGGWLYKHAPLSELTEQRAIVAAYLDIVDESPSSSEMSGPSLAPGNGQGQVPLRRVSSTGLFNTMRELGIVEPEEAPRDDGLEDLAEDEEAEEEGEYEDDALPEWARRDRFGSDMLGRLHAILSAHLPPELLTHLPPYSFPHADRIPFLTRLSDGQLLCTGYNAAVRKSRKQWGFIGAGSIHDIIKLEQKDRQTNDGKKTIGWTFRRMENLRLWAAALKLRYLVPLAPPPEPTLTPPSNHPGSPIQGVSRRIVSSGYTPKMSHILSSMGPPLIFDAKLIAKREEGWDEMLEDALEKWVELLLKETRDRSSVV